MKRDWNEVNLVFKAESSREGNRIGKETGEGIRRRREDFRPGQRFLIAACAAAKIAVGTRKGEQLT